MKIAPIIRALLARSDRFAFKLIHTGQHYDHEMSDVFFQELGIPKPDFHLEAGGGSHATQTAKIMVGFEHICLNVRPDCVLVVGDVNSTLACSIVAKKLQISVAHVEAGLRSGDVTMPEEINRLVTDAITDWFFVTEPSGRNHLLQEGKDPAKVHEVGHVMVDNLLYQYAQLDCSANAELSSQKLKQHHSRYGVVTLHRPSNVDDVGTFTSIASALRDASKTLPLIFPVHPRTRGNLEKFGIDLGPNIILTKPLSYMDFLNLWKDAVAVVTDSGGLQEETTALGVPCVTVRENTERPVTIDEGTNTLVGTDPEAILAAIVSIANGVSKKGRRPDLWDGKAAERIVAILDTVLK